MKKKSIVLRIRKANIIYQLIFHQMMTMKMMNLKKRKFQVKTLRKRRVLRQIKKGNNKETKKDDKNKTKYDHKVIVKLLRLLEIFTSIAIRNDRIHDFLIKVTQPQQVITLARLLVSCKSRHGLIILKIFENLINIRFDKNTLDVSFDKYKRSKFGKAVFDIDTKTRFDDCPFLQFLYNL